MNEKIQMAFEKSDKSIRTLRGLLLFLAILIALGGVVAGIVLWANSQEEHYSSFANRYYSSTNSLYVGLGFACFFGAPLLAIIGYRVEMIVVWFLFDVKVLRTVVAGGAPSKYLLAFSGAKAEGKSADTSVDTTANSAS